MLNWKKLLTVVVTLFQVLVFAQKDRNVSHYNLDENKIGLHGFDPVSYFPEGGGVGLKGSAEFELEIGGAIYHFVNLENLEIFKEDHEKYEPTYGGFCAYAMSFGNKVDIDPSLFTINGNRIHFFVSKRAKKNFDEAITDFETKADGFWMKISGEAPRL